MIEKFQCRRCRFLLFGREDLLTQHTILEDCSLWFLKDDDDMLPWILKLVEESGWTKGKLYCPQCDARVGAFDFLHVIACACGGECIPAIYCVRSKTDHSKQSETNQFVLDSASGSSEQQDQNKKENVNKKNTATDDAFSGEKVEQFEQSTDNVLDLKQVDDTANAATTRWCGKYYDNCSEEGEVYALNAEEESHFLSDSLATKKIVRSIYSSASCFDNKAFDSEVSDSEDQLLDLGHFWSNKANMKKKFFDSPKCPDKRYFTSHRTVPHVLHCSCCQSWYKKFIERSKSQRLNQNPRFNQHNTRLRRSVHDDFINISYDHEDRPGLYRPHPRLCPCQQDEYLSEHTDSEQEDDGFSPGASDGPLIFGNDFHENFYGNLEQQIGIHADLMEVQHELLSLQEDIIHNESQSIPTRSRRKPRKRGTRSNACTTTCARRHAKPHGSSNTCDDTVNDEGSMFELPDEFQCSVCLDVLYDPYITRCSHIFCAPCLRQLHKVSRRRPMCPLCRQQVCSVEPCAELQDNIKRLYPDIYRARSQVELRRPVNSLPLPSPSNVLFEREHEEAPGRLVHFFYVVRAFLIILFMLISYLLNGEERHNEQRRYARHIRLFIYFLVGFAFACSGVAVGILLAFYAYDFLKFLIGFCLFYLLVSKFLANYIVST